MNNKGKRVTLQDIATSCGISLSTVSRVLNNSVLVSNEKRDAILHAAEQLGYEKRTIRKHESRAILNIKLFLPDTRFTYINLFYDIAEFVKGLYQGFGDVKVNIIVRINQLDDEAFHNKKLGDIDGCIFAFTMPKPHLVQSIRERGIPILLVNRFSKGFDSVIYNTEQEMALLLEKILMKNQQRSRAHIKLCYVGFTPVAYINKERRQAIAQACDRFGVPFEVEHDVFEFQSLQEIPSSFLHELKRSGYNAIMSFNDVVALYLYQIGLKTGYSFPEDFSLTGHDDSPALEFIGKRIDTIRFDVFMMGQEAGKVLKDRVIGRSTELRQIQVDGEYIEGDTI